MGRELRTLIVAQAINGTYIDDFIDYKAGVFKLVLQFHSLKFTMLLSGRCVSLTKCRIATISCNGKTHFYCVT